MTEKRKEPRRKLMAFTPVYEAGMTELLGYLGDLTIQGALVIGQKAMEPDSQATLTIKFPASLPGSASPRIRVSARVAWCRADEESAQYFNIGFEFTEVKPEHKETIQAILARYQFRRSIPNG